MRIAILDQDSQQADLVAQILINTGHQCKIFESSKTLMQVFQQDGFDMLILDWQINEENADSKNPEVVSWVKQKVPATFPILFITNRLGEDDIIRALSLGATDYVVKPVRRNELLVRIHAALRRAYPERNLGERIRFGDHLFETRSSRLTINGEFIDLTQKEFNLALLLFRNMGRPLSRAYILESVWSRGVEVPSRTMDTHISRVRTKLKLRPEFGYRLTPVYSYGYRLEQVTNA